MIPSWKHPRYPNYPYTLDALFQLFWTTLQMYWDVEPTWFAFQIYTRHMLYLELVEIQEAIFNKLGEHQ